MKHRTGSIVTAAVLVAGLLSACGATAGEATITGAQVSSSSSSPSVTSVPSTTPVPELVKTPNLAKLSVKEGTAAIKAAGLAITVTGDTSDPAYGALSQTPAAGSKVPKGSVVTVVVGESTDQKKEREKASAAAEAAADEAARVEAERIAAEEAATAEAARVEAERVAAKQAAASAAAASEAAAAAAAAGTVSQQNAVRSAGDYLEYTAFSRTGLIEQLEYEGFSNEDAVWGVDGVTVDWNEQAAKSAKDYLEYTSFSRSGLVEQLVYEGFTPAQAEYGVSKTGL